VRALRERGEVHKILSRYGAIDQEGGAAWDDTEIVLEIARAYSLVNNDSKVERYFLRCAELNPRRAALYRCQIGWFFQRKKRWARALLWYDQALETFPGYHLCLFRKGYCLERLHRPREASEALRQAADSFDRTGEDQRERSRGIQVQVLFHLARNLREIGETAAAREVLDRCGELDDRGGESVIKPEHRLASYGETYLRDNDPEKALEHLEQAKKRDSRSAVIWERLGRAYEMLGDKKSAEAAYRTAVDLPKGAIALVSLARFLVHAGRFREAAQALAQALDRHPQGEVQIRMEIAELQRRLGRPAAALDELLQLSTGRVPPKSTLAASIDARIAEILVEHDHLTRALPHLEAALAQLPDDAALRARLDEARRRIADGPPEKRTPLENAPLPDEVATTLSFEVERLTGRVETYFPDRGFGFIRYRESETIFFHVSHCPSGVEQQIAVGVEVSFVCGVNHRNGKPQAEQIRIERPTAQAAAAGRGRVEPT
jgi:tetratricopeptide (TPR) repeat protein/cold shock CspA family protein